MHSKDSNSYDKIPSKYINSVSDAAHSENEMVFARMICLSLRTVSPQKLHRVVQHQHERQNACLSLVFVSSWSWEPTHNCIDVAAKSKGQHCSQSNNYFRHSSKYSVVLSFEWILYNHCNIYQGVLRCHAGNDNVVNIYKYINIFRQVYLNLCIVCLIQRVILRHAQLVLKIS